MVKKLLVFALTINLLTSSAEAFSLAEYFNFRSYFNIFSQIFKRDNLDMALTVEPIPPLLGDNSGLVSVKLERSYSLDYKTKNVAVNNNTKSETFKLPDNNNIINANPVILPKVFNNPTQNQTSAQLTYSITSTESTTTPVQSVNSNNTNQNIEVVTPATTQVANSCINCFEKRYIYYGGNFARGLKEADPSFKTLIDIIKRGSKSGYNGVVVNAAGSGSFTSVLSATPYHANFYTNINELVRVAKEYKMEIIPSGLTPQSITQLKSELEEAYPVIDTKLKVANGVAKVVINNLATDPSFEEGNSNWKLLDKGVSIEASVGHNSSTSVKLSANDGANMMRLYREFKNMKPYTAYRMHYTIKTENFDSTIHLQIYDGRTENKLYDNQTSSLGWGTTNGVWNNTPNTKNNNQDWMVYNVDFNTLANTEFRVYLGTWSNISKTGLAYIDNISIEELALSHIVRRDSLPIVVKDAHTGLVYTENQDYIIGTEKLTIPATSRIVDGDELLVSWWQSARGTAYGYMAEASACHDEYFTISNGIYDKTGKLFDTSNFFIYYDEWRTMNWDKSCNVSSAADYLAKTTKRVTDDMYRLDGQAEIYVWNDMYDPYANAVGRYYMVNGSLVNSHLGLDKRVIIANWNQVNNEAQLSSLKFFSSLGNRQILSLYYDDSTLAKTDAWINNLKRGEQEGVKNVIGFMYTAWRGDNSYADLERVAERIKALAPDKWPSN